MGVAIVFNIIKINNIMATPNSITIIKVTHLCIPVILFSGLPGPGEVTTISLCSCRLSAVSVSVDEVVSPW